MRQTKDLLDQMMEYESGELDGQSTLEMFSALIKNDMDKWLQGHYGRMADALIQNEWLDNEGNIIKNFKQND